VEEEEEEEEEEEGEISPFLFRSRSAPLDARNCHFTELHLAIWFPYEGRT
jgi:hypothetical protein